MLAPEPYRRHDWVWLRQDWRRYLQQPVHEADNHALENWLVADRPLVVARRMAGDEETSLRLGLALPEKRRIGVNIALEAVARCAGPVALRNVQSVIPHYWRVAVERLLESLAEIGECPRIFGSLVWQYYAADRSLIYLTEKSDIDLLFEPRAWEFAEELVGRLLQFEAVVHHPRLDGEFVLPDGNAVSWRELAGRPAKVLAKNMTTIKLLAFEDIPALFNGRFK